MDVLGLDWVGTRTQRFQDTVAFFEHNLGLPIGLEREDFVRFDLPDASAVEVFGPSDREHLYFTTDPVVGFLVRDVERARGELSAAGLELLGPLSGEPASVRWQHFRAPDGYVYEVVENPGRSGRRRAPGPLGITHIAWFGTRTPHYAAMQAFFATTLSLRLVEELPGLTEYGLPDGSSAEVFLPGSPLDHPHFSTGPAPAFGVTDIDAAMHALEAQGIGLIVSKLRETGGWAHFRAPDGNVYEVKGPRRQAGPGTA